MGASTNGILCYGVDLGEAFDKLQPCPFLDEIEADDSIDPSELIVNKLLAAAGFTEPDPHPEAGRGDPGWDESIAWSRRRDAAEKALLVELVTHCSDSAPMLILAARPVLTAYWGDPETVDLAALVDKHATNAREAAVEGALEVLGMTPGQEPGWLLASRWG